jgi:hypothetical protein
MRTEAELIKLQGQRSNFVCDLLVSMVWAFFDFCRYYQLDNPKEELQLVFLLLMEYARHVQFNILLRLSGQQGSRDFVNHELVSHWLEDLQLYDNWGGKTVQYKAKSC